jgi:2-polyprenyl-6-methoxyphenol hydroxylase-like FAD-dependent oxidoreductase
MNLGTEVLVVGAGPVGLTLAIDLGRRGVRCTLIERNAEGGVLPKMDLSNARTMEIYGRLGLAEKIRRAGWPLDARFDVHVGPSLVEKPYITLPYPSILEMQKKIATCQDGSMPREPYERISQYNVEGLLRKEAEAMDNVTVLFGHGLVDFEERDDYVVARIRKRDGNETTITSSFLVGCDGGNSTVRNILGIGLSGETAIARMFMIFFRCPSLLEKTGLQPFRHFYLAGNRQGALVAQDDLKRWSLHIQIAPDADVSKLDPGIEIKEALGIELETDVIYAGAWTPHLVVANQYQKGRILIAGDAGHQYIPTGGFGMNTGIGEADNLGWKLAATLRGWGGPRLLQSYEEERHPIAERNCKAAAYAAEGSRSWRNVYDPSVMLDTPKALERRGDLVEAINAGQRRSHEMHGIEMGYRYMSSSICLHESGSLPDPDSPVYIPTATPGARLPHAWLEPGISIHDRVGQHFTLLAIGAETPQVAAFEAAARRLGLPFDVLNVGDRADLLSIYGARLLLLRPDLHVVWRGDQAADPGMLLALGMGHADPLNPS